MREVKTITYNVYTFDELPENIKEAVVKDHGEELANDWDYFFADGVVEEWKSKLEEQGFSNPDICYTGFWSQGDGASFTCNNIDMIKLCDHLELWPLGKEKTYKTLINELLETAYIKRTNTHYYHERSTTYYAFAINTYRCRRAQRAFATFLQDIESAVEDHIISLGIDIYKALEDDYEYYQSDEYVIQDLKERDYHYVLNKEGELVERRDY